MMVSTVQRFLNPYTLLPLLFIRLVTGIPFVVATTPFICPDGKVVCGVERVWTLAELAAQITLPPPKGHAFLVDESGLTIVFHRVAVSPDRVTLFWFTGEESMTRVEKSDYWTATVWFEGLDEGLFTFGLSDGSMNNYPFATYYGVNAPRIPPVNAPLVGHLKTIPFKSAALEQTRLVSVYLPPQHDASRTYPTVYMTDGETLANYAGSLDYLITEGVVPPLIVVGTASGAGRWRGEEYVMGRNPTRFERHARFFTQEVRAWAEAELGASPERAQRGIFGVSNGGLFTVAMTVQQPDLYGFAFVFSAGASAGFEELFHVDSTTIKLPLSVYGTAGTLEPVFLNTTTRYVNAYQDAGAGVRFSRNVASHDDAIWQIEFVNAVRWLFGT